jgi:hypothetical protein
MKPWVVLIAFPSPALAQGLDFLEERIAVDVATATVTHVDVTVTIRVVSPTSEAWILEPPLPIDALDVNGSPAASAPHPSYPGLVRVVDLGRTFEAGEELDLEIRCSGELSCASRSAPGTIACVRNAGETVLVPSSVDLAWYPINLFDLDAFVGSIEVRAPPSFEIAAGQGAPVDDRIEGGVRIARFAIPIPSELFSVYAADALRIESGSVVGLHRTGRPDLMAKAVELGAEIVPLYEERFGVRAVDRTTIVAIPRGFPFGGIGLIGTILIGDYVVGELDYLLEQGVAHELAHTWWGGLAIAEAPEEAGFFSEAFAEYAGRWALGRIQGETTRTAAHRMNAVWYMLGRTDGVDVPILDPAVRDSSAYVFVTYHKGSVVLRTLEAAVGEERFTAVLRDLIGRGRVGSPALLEALGAVGYDATVDVEQWLRRTGYPELRVSRTGGGLEIDPGDYRLHLVLRIDGRDVTTEVGPGPTLVPIEGDPTLIEADPDWTMVRAITPAVRADVSLDGRAPARRTDAHRAAPRRRLRSPLRHQRRPARRRSRPRRDPLTATLPPWAATLPFAAVVR